MAEQTRAFGRGTRGVLREIDQELARVNRGLEGYERLLGERQRLLAARAAITGERHTSARARTSQDDVAAYLQEHPDSWPGEIAAALSVPVTNVSAHLYRGKRTRFIRTEHGWRVRSEGGRMPPGDD
jgi:hypothetical protein